MMNNKTSQKIDKILRKHFSTSLNAKFTFMNPISFKESRINKNAVIIENEHYYSKIIFPDYKFDLNLNIASKDYTIRNLIDESAKKYQQESILSISFAEEDGTPIANSTPASLLTRLSCFQIIFDGGDRIYNCVNPKYLGNSNLETGVITKNSNRINLDQVEKLVFEEGVTFRTALSLSKGSKGGVNPNLNSNSNLVDKTVTYSNILKDYMRTKYSIYNEYFESIREKRERRIQKFLNTFFYICLTQTAALNLGTFVFFNWDFMEPITTCITYLNLIVGYYFWAITNTDYEMESMVYWLKKRKHFFTPGQLDRMMQEKYEIEKLIAEDIIKH